MTFPGKDIQKLDTGHIPRKQCDLTGESNEDIPKDVINFVKEIAVIGDRHPKNAVFSN